MAQSGPPANVGSMEGLGPTPERRTVRPALGHKHWAREAQCAGLLDAAAFIEAQNAEIEYLYATIQGLRDRARRAGFRNKVAACIRSEAEFALQYGA